MSATLPNPETHKPSRIHPLMAVAAIALIGLSATGIAAMTGLIGKPMANTAEQVPALTTPAPVANATIEAPVVPAPVVPAPVQVKPAPVARPAPSAAARNWAVVESVREVKTDGEPGAVGTIGGAVVGGVLGHQVGKGTGRDVGTVLGAVGGAFAGRAIESKVRSTSRFDITVRFNDNTTRTFSRAQPWGWAVGDRVHIVNGQLAARNTGSQS